MSDVNNEILLPFLTNNLEGIGGNIRTIDEDFFVEEIPVYQPSGEGTHIYGLMEKKGISTIEAITRIAAAFKMRRRDIGFAGLKDARAVTRQWISVEHIEPEQLLNFDSEKIKILKVARHSNKIKQGHLSGNRFVIRIRNFKDSPEKALKKAEEIFSVLSARGIPNYFGPQRFGNRVEANLLGQTMARGDFGGFVDLFLGRPSPKDTPAIFTARQLYDNGEYEKALETWPRSCRDQKFALKVLIYRKGKKNSAFVSIDRKLRSFYVSAYQSEIFNKVLAARMPNIDKLLQGDFAYKHDNGACFVVEDAAVEQSRCDNFLISPTGPLIGLRMTRLAGPAGAIENRLLEEEHLTDEDLQRMNHFGAKGGRRSMRCRLQDLNLQVGSDGLGQFLEASFFLDSGCYATCVLREITKTNLT
jgi:tRNA pseudouridine13 synthase